MKIVRAHDAKKQLKRCKMCQAWFVPFSDPAAKVCAACKGALRWAEAVQRKQQEWKS